MNPYYNKDKVNELYPEAGELMFPPQLIWKLPAGKEDMKSEVCSNGEYFAQEKMDGALYLFTKTLNYSYLFGRTKSTKTGLQSEKGANVPHIIGAFSCLPPNTVLLGEIFVPGGTSKDVTHIMGCLAPEAIKRQNKEGNIHYYVYDILYLNGECLMEIPAIERYEKLSNLWNKYSLNQYDFLHLAKVYEENIEDELSRILSSGGEGMVLKKKDAPYRPGSRKAWENIKFKQMDSVDLVITRTIPATKEYTGKDIETWPYWEHTGIDFNMEGYKELLEGFYYNTSIKLPGYIPVTKPYFLGWRTSIGIGAYNDAGELVELGTVSSGITDDMRRLMTEFPDGYVGHVCALDCMSIDRKEKTLRHPVFKCMRDDKNAEDCKISEVFK